MLEPKTNNQVFNMIIGFGYNASVNSKHHTPLGIFLKVVKFPAPGQKTFAKLRPRGKK